MNTKPLRCDICGKFIAYNDIGENVTNTYTPDTEVSIESNIFKHKKCQQKSINIAIKSLEMKQNSLIFVY